MNDRTERLRGALQCVGGHAPGDGLPKHRRMAARPLGLVHGAAQPVYADVADDAVSAKPAVSEGRRRVTTLHVRRPRR